MRFFVIFLFAIVAVVTAVEPDQQPKSELEFQPSKGHSNDERENGPKDEPEKRNVETRRVCVPGTSSKNYCNICRCNNDGTANVCTQRRCGIGEFEKDGQRPYVDYDMLSLRKAPEPSIVENLSLPPFDTRCEPEKTFKFYCNTCQCGKDGVPVSCTLAYCVPGVYNRDGSKVIKDGEVELKWQNDELAAMRCEPDTLFSYYCNRCFCSAFGTVAYCSSMQCPPGVYNRDGSKVIKDGEIELKWQNDELAAMRCEPDTVFSYYCNRCFCSASGTVAYCSSMQCPPGVYNRDGSKVIKNTELKLQWQNDELSAMRCKPHSTFSYYCNHCFCSDTGNVAYCSSMQCPPGVYNRDGSKVIKNTGSKLQWQNDELSAMRCKPHSTFSYYCNHCFCSDTGTVAYCSSMQCPPGLYNRDGSKVIKNEEVELKLQNDELATMRCEPNTNFAYYCNQCRCSESGTVLYCSSMQCPPGVYNRDGSRVNNTHGDGDFPIMKREIEEDFSTIRCEPNGNFMHYCNLCRCAETGVGASCTFIACPPGVYNRDGSLREDSNENDIHAEAQPEEEEDDSLAPSDNVSGFSQFLDQPISCQPYEYFARYCNFCQCSSDGQSVYCVHLGCPPLPKSEAFLSLPLILRSRRSPNPVKVCEPNSFFQKSCNQCKCDDDGLAFECTLKLCPQ